MKELENIDCLSCSKQDLIEAIWKVGVPKDDIGYGTPVGNFKKFDSHGGGIWQIPDQLASLCILLRNYKIESFLEIGTWTGYTFTFISNFLEKNNKEIELFSCDVKDKRQVFPKNANFILGNSYKFIEKSFDLVFIDGDHSYEWVKKDYENVGRRAKICVFHDIVSPSKSCEGVVNFWSEIKNNFDKNKIFEFTSCGEGRNLGIGVVIQDESL